MVHSHSGRIRGAPESGNASARVSTDGLSRQFGISLLNRALAHGILGSTVHEVNDQPLEAVMIECSLPGLNFHWADSSPMRATRPGPPATANGEDCIFFGAVTAPRVSIQLGREHSLAAGEGILVGNPGAADTIYSLPCQQLALVVPRSALDPRLREKSTQFVQRVPAGNGAMRLLVSYLDSLKNAAVPPELEQSIAAHVHDLLAVMLGATRDGIEIAKTRGIRAARLHAIKKEIVRTLHSDLSLDTVAARHRLSSRYVQMLFEQDGTSFTAFVREQRLLRARAMLVSPRFDHKRIGEIAYEVGFNDLSYFNRTFVQRFGMTPGEARAAKIAT